MRVRRVKRALLAAWALGAIVALLVLRPWGPAEELPMLTGAMARPDQASDSHVGGANDGAAEGNRIVERVEPRPALGAGATRWVEVSVRSWDGEPVDSVEVSWASGGGAGSRITIDAPDVALLPASTWIRERTIVAVSSDGALYGKGAWNGSARRLEVVMRPAGGVTVVPRFGLADGVPLTVAVHSFDGPSLLARRDLRHGETATFYGLPLERLLVVLTDGIETWAVTEHSLVDQRTVIQVTDADARLQILSASSADGWVHGSEFRIGLNVDGRRFEIDQVPVTEPGQVKLKLGTDPGARVTWWAEPMIRRSLAGSTAILEGDEPVAVTWMRRGLVTWKPNESPVLGLTARVPDVHVLVRRPGSERVVARAAWPSGGVAVPAGEEVLLFLELGKQRRRLRAVSPLSPGEHRELSFGGVALRIVETLLPEGQQLLLRILPLEGADAARPGTFRLGPSQHRLLLRRDDCEWSAFAMGATEETASGVLLADALQIDLSEATSNSRQGRVVHPSGDGVAGRAIVALWPDGKSTRTSTTAEGWFFLPRSRPLPRSLAVETFDGAWAELDPLRPDRRDGGIGSWIVGPGRLEVQFVGPGPFDEPLLSWVMADGVSIPVAEPATLDRVRRCSLDGRAVWDLPAGKWRIEMDETAWDSEGERVVHVRSGESTRVRVEVRPMGVVELPPRQEAGIWTLRSLSLKGWLGRAVVSGPESEPSHVRAPVGQLRARWRPDEGHEWTAIYTAVKAENDAR